MRVLHLVKTSEGAPWALRQMSELVRLGVEVHVALPGHGRLVQRYREAGVHTHLLQLDFPVRAPWRGPEILVTLRKLVDKIKPELIHSHFVGTTLTMRLALGRSHPIPRIFQVPGPLHLEHGFFRRAEIASAGQSDFWIGSCRWTCGAYEQAGVPSDRIGLAYYGVDIERFTPRQPGKLRWELDLGPSTKIVGMVAFIYVPKRYLGQTRGLKGHEDLIDAIALTLECGEDLVCVMVGGAWNGAHAYEDNVRKYARQQCGDRVIFLGTRNDVADLYAGMDVVVHPSHSENVGGAAESLLLGVPTIATNVGGLPDLVQPGRTGWLVPPRQPSMLAAAIREALNAPEMACLMAARGRELTRQLFDVRQTARSVYEMYQAIGTTGTIIASACSRESTDCEGSLH